MNNEISNVCLANINGEIIRYDAACLERNPLDQYGKDYHPESAWNYLGEGTIHAINGVTQLGEQRLHFWSKK